MLKWIMTSIVMGMLLIVPNVGAATSNVNVLFVLDDGSYHWQKAKTGSALNASIGAAEAASIDFNYTNSSYGAYVTGIGNVDGPSNYSAPDFWYWELMIWNQTNSSWDESQVGASDLFLKNGDSIAWIQSNHAPPNETPSKVIKSISDTKEMKQWYVLVIVSVFIVAVMTWFLWAKKED